LPSTRDDPIRDADGATIGTLPRDVRWTDMEPRSHHSARREQGILRGPSGQRDLEALGWDFRHVYPVDKTSCFRDLLRAIDDAERGAQPSIRSTRTC
jgi:hypothetical protein